MGGSRSGVCAGGCVAAAEMLQPAAQQPPVGRGDPPVPGLAAALVEVVKGDLPPVNVEPAYDPHGGLLKLHHS